MHDLVRIIVVDDHPVFRSGLVQLLELNDRFRVVAEAGSVSEAIALAQTHKANIVTLDLSMGESGLDAIVPLRSQSPETRIIVLTASDAAFDVQTALDRGIDGYVLKGATGAEIIEAIRIVSAGEKFISPRAMSRALSSERANSRTTKALLDQLSPREGTVLEMIAQGHSNREIGEKLGIEEKSVKFHVTNIFAKLGVRNRVEAALSFKQ
jgi:two-component system, NarL family, nitrate/nitrite response regulator NarL